MKWIVVADAAKARIFSTAKNNDSWSQVTELTHPEARHKISDMYRDEPNVTSSSSRAGNDVIEPATDLKEKEVEKFAKELSDYLEENHHQHNFDRLCIIAAPNFLGSLRPLLHKGVEEKIEQSIDKNLSDLNIHDLQKYYKKHLED